MKIIATPLAAALIFFVIVFLFVPYREAFHQDVDEGYNLMRSMLVSSGYPLYRQVSSDQPPLFTYLLVPVLRLTGMNVNPVRLLVLLFSTLLVWSFAQFLQLIWGSLPALLLPFLFLLLPRYIQLSTSVMIGIPALTLASLSLLSLLLWHLRRRRRWLILSGVMLSASIMVKMFTFFLVPIFVAGILIHEFYPFNNRQVKWTHLQPALVWSISFVVGLTGVLFLFGKPAYLAVLLQSHLLSSTVEYFQEDRYTLNYFLVRDKVTPFLILAFLSLYFIFKTRRFVTFYLVAWAVAAFLILQFYLPVWYHHQLLVTVPAAVLCAISTGEGMHSLARNFRSRELMKWSSPAYLAVMVVSIFVTASALPDLTDQFAVPRLSGYTLQDHPKRLNVYRIMQEYAPRTNWVVTDFPIFAFRINRPVPPILATFSRKRYETGSLTDSDILSAIKKYKPEQILFTRFESPMINRYLDRMYTLVYKETGFRLYIRSDVYNLVEPSFSIEKEARIS